MIDAIDADMHARPGDAELTPWLLVLDCAPQHMAAHRTVLRPAELHGIHSAAGPGVHGRLQELDPSRGGQTLRRVLLGSRVQLRTCQSGLQHRSAPTAAALIRADSPQHRTAGWRFIDWNEVEQLELVAEAKRFLETGELFPRGTAEEPHAPEAHVLEPLADDHSSDSDDAPTGVEESAAPAVAAAPKRSHESA